MKKKLMILCLVLSLTSSLTAVLPPLYTTLAEFQQLIDSPELKQVFQAGEAIINIRLENGYFIVTTTRSRLKVEIVSEPQSQVGPAKFHLKFYEVEKLPN